MKVLKLLHVGDIHYPQHLASTELVDLKDNAANQYLVQMAAPPPLTSAIRELHHFCEDNKNTLGGILICGDLTSWGNLNAYAQCAQWLYSSLGPPRFSIQQLHAVPGNHDVDRTKCDSAGADLLGKFLPLLEIWDNLDTPVLAANRLRQETVSADGCSASVFSLNSCLGCQEKRNLPTDIRDALHKLLEKVIEEKGLEEAFELVGEQIDTPAFSEEDVAEAVRQIRLLQPHVMPIVLAHHNLLPQARLRVALYTEVLNSGLVRSRFSTCSRPLIYCHGHIHDDPIEIVTPSRPAHGKLISISAPEFVKGFNVIEIHYANEGLPLGCVVVPYRRQSHLGIEPETPIRIPVRGLADYLAVADPLLEHLLPLLVSQPRRFRELLHELCNRTEQQHKESGLQEALLEAEWFGLIVIDNREQDCKHWQIRRATP